jgi:hypothetical protein
MELKNSRPLIMADAREDLAGNLSGEFSPGDWVQILDRAERRWRHELSAIGGDELAAWQTVIREFHQQSYWGFSPDYKPRETVGRGPRNLGITFIWMAFQTFVLTKIAVVWLGQVYTRTQDPRDGLLFYSAIVLVLANFGFFLWRHRNHED